MKGLCLAITARLANNALDTIKRDIDKSSAAGAVPMTLWVIGGILLGAMAAGFIGAIIGGIAGAVLRGGSMSRWLREVLWIIFRTLFIQG